MILNNFISHYWQHIIVAMLAISVFCFWLFLYPFIPVVREMSILFLWNTDYLMERLAIPGGLAQYLGEGVAQFFVNPFNGAIIYAVLFVVAQLLSMKLLKQFFPTIKKQWQDELLKGKNDSLGGSMVYPYWHPGGRYCAFSTNKTSQMFHTANVKRIEVYDNESDVFIYDTQTHTVLKDTLTMKLLWAENTPAFSPDGKWLYYTTALRQLYPPGYDKECYSLCRVSFDEHTGRLGTQVDTLINGQSSMVNGQSSRSVTWPRPSYDGRYLMYTQVDYGYFSIWHPEADLWLLDLSTGETRALDEVNSDCAESLHSWSSNSRWFLFNSRRDDGLYSRIYLSMMGKDGRATKPFMLPQRNPKEFYRQLLYSYNTPDFTSRPVNSNARQIGRNIESDLRTPTKVEVYE
ncbi:MAG: PD40 domain-containing protein [Prevotella sp.]|nr:PD40 domain-containing protein [Prevotella sp.]